METECDVLLSPVWGAQATTTKYMNNDGLVSLTVVKRRPEALTATNMNDSLILQTGGKEKVPGADYDIRKLTI